MDPLDAVEKILHLKKNPLHYRNITKKILEEGFWQSEGKTPEQTINARLSVDIKRYGDKSRFVRTGPGTYGLREWADIDNDETSHADAKLKYSFTDAAEYILEKFAEKRPMHYREITEKVMELNLVETEGKTPEATLYAMVLTEIKRASVKGKKPRFIKYGKGIIGLRDWVGEGLAYQIDQQNKDVRKQLLAHLRNLSPAEFEQLIGILLGEMGFEEVEVTSLSGDGGIDIRGTLVVGDVVRTKMAVQAKRWQNNVQKPVVQQVRGSLGAHEQGMIITSSDFSKGAIDEASRKDATPVALMNGEQLVDLLIEHEVLVRKEPYELIYLALDE